MMMARCLLSVAGRTITWHTSYFSSSRAVSSEIPPRASWRYRPLNPIFTGAPSYSTGRRSRASPRSGLFVETSSCFPENESRMLFTLSGAMTLTRFRTSTNAPRGDVRDDPVLLGDDLPVIREIRVEKPDPHLRVPLSGEKELLRGGQLQGARPPVGKLPDLDQPLSRDEHALFPQNPREVRDLPVRAREPVSVRGHHA